MKKIVNEFMKKSPQDRVDLFKINFSSVPSIEVRANFFLMLPTDECIRILDETSKMIEINFMFDHILKSPKGKNFILKILPQLSVKTFANIVFDTLGILSHFKDLPDKLPIETIAKVVNAISIIPYGKDYRDLWIHTSDCIKITCQTDKERFKQIISLLSPQSFKIMYQYNIDFGQSKFTQIVAMCNEDKIVEFCSALPTRRTLLILKLLSSDTLKTVSVRLPQGHRDTIFKSFSKKNENLPINEKDINLKNLDRNSRKVFVKNFPKSSQIGKLSFAEKIDAIF